MSQDRLSAFQVLVSSFAISSLGGVAALLRSHKEITLRTVLSAILYSGLTGLIIALLWYNSFDGKGNTYFLLGVSGLAGIGGTTVIDFVIQAVKNGGINVIITSGAVRNPGGDPENDDESEDA